MAVDHGGALDRAIARWGGERADWLDLSTGINPVPIHLPEFPADIWNRLPDEALLNAALEGARAFYRLPERARVVAGPGTQALIQILPELRPAGEVAIVAPTYGEHAACLRRCGWRVTEIMDLAELPDTAVAAVLVNPNNPDGRVTAQSAILSAFERLRERNGLLIVDEAFSDMHPETSVAEFAADRGLVVLKSFGKFFGLAGVRFGLAVTHAEDADKLAQRLGPWAVSGPALAAAAHAFADPTGIHAMRERLRHQRDLLSGVFRATGLEEVGGTALFALLAHPAARLIHAALCRRSILARRFCDAPTWLRFGLPRDENDAVRLESALLAALDEVVSSADH